MMSKPRAVFACNVFLQAVAQPNSQAAACLNLAENKLARLFVSEWTLAELEQVLKRPKIRTHFVTLTDETVSLFLKRIQETGRIIRSIPRKFVFARDPDDEPYINLAIAAEADYIVTRDKDLLDLMTGHNDECKEFRQRFRPLKIVGPGEFLHALLPTEM